jgi:hypothetical protein
MHTRIQVARVHCTTNIGCTLSPRTSMESWTHKSAQSFGASGTQQVVRYGLPCLGLVENGVTPLACHRVHCAGQRRRRRWGCAAPPMTVTPQGAPHGCCRIALRLVGRHRDLAVRVHGGPSLALLLRGACCGGHSHRLRRSRTRRGRQRVGGGVVCHSWPLGVTQGLGRRQS